VSRGAIACLWVASIVATWLIVRRATTEEAAPPAKPVARDGAVHVASPRALPAREATMENVALGDLEDTTAFREALATLERDLADGRWGTEDRERLSRGMRNVTATQAARLYDVLLPKLNTGVVTSDIDGPPL
jgi:hypothetical protein